MTNHSPGPWNISKSTYALTIENNNGCRIAQCSKNERYTVQQKSNAQLISAAPDLLEALKNLWAVCDKNNYDVPMGYRNQIFTAINKAEAI